MKGCLNAFLTFVFGLCVFVWLILFQFRSATEPVFINNALDKADLYKTASQVISELARNSSGSDSQNQFFPQIISQVTEPQALKKETQGFVTGFLQYFKGRTQTLVLNIDLISFKQLLNQNVQLPPNTIAQMVEMLKQLPVCPTDPKNTSNQQEALAGGCRPADLDLSQFEGKNSLNEAIPDQMDIGPSLLKSDPRLAKTKALFHRIEIVFWAITVLALVLMALLYLMVRNWRNLTNRLGWQIFLPSFTLGGLELLGLFLPGLIKPQLARLVETNQLLLNNFWPIYESLNRSFLLLGIKLAAGFAIAGLIIIIVSFFLPKESNQSEEIKQNKVQTKGV